MVFKPTFKLLLYKIEINNDNLHLDLLLVYDEWCVTDVTFPFLHKIKDIIILYTTFVFGIFDTVSI